HRGRGQARPGRRECCRYGVPPTVPHRYRRSAAGNGRHFFAPTSNCEARCECCRHGGGPWGRARSALRWSSRLFQSACPERSRGMQGGGERVSTALDTNGKYYGHVVRNALVIG